MKNAAESQSETRFTVPVSVQIVIGTLLLMLALLWHVKYRSYKKVSKTVATSTVPDSFPVRSELS